MLAREGRSDMARTPSPHPLCHRNGPFQISCIWQEKWTYLFPKRCFPIFKNKDPYSHLHKQDIFFLNGGDGVSDGAWEYPPSSRLCERGARRGGPRTEASGRWQWHTGWVRPCIVMQLGRRMRWQTRFPLALHRLCAWSHRSARPTPTNYCLPGTIPRNPPSQAEHAFGWVLPFVIWYNGSRHLCHVNVRAQITN